MLNIEINIHLIKYEMHKEHAASCQIGIVVYKNGLKNMFMFGQGYLVNRRA